MTAVSVWLTAPAEDTSVCTRAERKRAARFGSPTLGTHWLGARAVLRVVLAGVTGDAAGDLRIEVSDGGKPVLPGRRDVHFNLSHSGDVVAVAVADRPVGIDVEAHRRLRSPTGVARRLGLSSTDPDAVLRAWVRTEALLKATGAGARAGLAHVEDRLAAAGWSVCDIDAGAGIFAAVAAHGPALEVRGPLPLPEA